MRALAGVDFTMRSGRVRRGDGSVGLRQVDLAQPRRRARHADRRRDLARGRVARRQERGRARDHAPPAHRHRVPVLQPARGHERAGERDAAGGDRRRAAQARGDARATCSTSSASPTRRRTHRACCRVVSASGSRSRARSPTSRRCCSPTSRPVRSTPRVVTRCSSCSAASTPGGQTILLVTHDDDVAAAGRPDRAHARRPHRVGGDRGGAGPVGAGRRPGSRG